MTDYKTTFTSVTESIGLCLCQHSVVVKYLRFENRDKDKDLRFEDKDEDKYFRFEDKVKDKD